MRKIVCILMLVVPLLSFCQDSSFGFSGGFATNGFGFHASYNYELSENGYLQTGLFASKSIDKSSDLEVPYTTLALNIGYYYNLVKDRNSQFIGSIGAGPSVGYEIINNGDTELDNGALINGNSGIVYGGFIGTELKYFISDEIALMGVVNTYLYANSDLGTASLYAGLGVKVYIF